MQSQSQLAFDDLRTGLARYRVWVALARADIMQRYKRSKIGQFWITISMTIFIFGVGIIYSQLFKQNIVSYLPMLALNFVFWTLMSSSINEAANSFIAASDLLKNAFFYKSVFVYRVVFRNVITFFHNIIIVPIVFVLFLPPLDIKIPLLLFTLVLMMGFLLSGSIIVAIISTRFRDFPLILTSLLQLMMFVTPVMWSPSQASETLLMVQMFNPFGLVIILLNGAIFGGAMQWSVLYSLIFWNVVLFTVALWLFKGYRAKIAYWL